MKAEENSVRMCSGSSRGLGGHRCSTMTFTLTFSLLVTIGIVSFMLSEWSLIGVGLWSFGELVYSNKFHPEASFPQARPINPPVSKGSSVNANVWRKAQNCLLDSPHLSGHLPELLTQPRKQLGVDSDLENHYLEMLRVTEPFRKTQYHSYIDYSGPWLENAWIDEFCCNRSLSSFGGLIPLFVPWTDVWLANGRNDGYLTTVEGMTFLKTLRKDVIYITIVQMDDGLFINERYWKPRENWNILILSAGGYGHAPLPLFNKELSPVEMVSEAPNVFVFVGSNLHAFPVRKVMADVLEKVSAIPPFFAFRTYHGKEWINVTRSGLLSLAPRGYGRSSFRTTELVQLGLVPIYIYDDVDWSSYKGSKAHLSEFGFVLHVDEFKSFVYNTTMGLRKDPDYLRLNERRAKILEIRDSHFTITGVIQQIRLFLQGDSRSDISCQRVPYHPTLEPAT